MGLDRPFTDGDIPDMPGTFADNQHHHDEISDPILEFMVVAWAGS